MIKSKKMMDKRNESIRKYIYIIIFILIFISLIGLKIYKTPTKITKTFENVLVMDHNNQEIGRTNIKIDGCFYNDTFIWEILGFRKILDGNIQIGDQSYYLLGSYMGKFTDNVTWGSINTSPDELDYKYVFFISKDTNRIYIRSSDNENYELMYPVNTKQDYYALKSEMYGE